ncbi:hypothetical protein B0T25DRAFT_55926 [Lasiosphaeria hispida]|uniref:Uncharacterized protein n=1 Tax=Lasiosphaeria hispida TaxID=260671 RepID=A0AAJ0HWF3_9PEZI|nr:hypothetical protein B0T25DRAFT_55926 [Lasiosphaeria hispida]
MASGCDVGWRALMLHTMVQKRLCGATRSESQARSVQATCLGSGGALSGCLCLAAGVCGALPPGPTAPATPATPAAPAALLTGHGQSQPSMSWAVARLVSSTARAVLSWASSDSSHDSPSAWPATWTARRCSAAFAEKKPTTNPDLNHHHARAGGDPFPRYPPIASSRWTKTWPLTQAHRICARPPPPRPARQDYRQSPAPDA